MKCSFRFVRPLLLILFCLQATHPVSAQQTEAFMKSLGFRKSDSAYLYPLTQFRYYCNARQTRPYLVVTERSLDSLRSSGDKERLDYIQGPDLRWQILLPEPATPGKLRLRMKGPQIADDADWKQLRACFAITLNGKAKLSDEQQEQALIEEALQTWKELLSWYQSGK